jgi:hypothetical protein
VTKSALGFESSLKVKSDHLFFPLGTSTSLATSNRMMCEFVQNKEGLIGFEIFISSKANEIFSRYLLTNTMDK